MLQLVSNNPQHAVQIVQIASEETRSLSSPTCARQRKGELFGRLIEPLWFPLADRRLLEVVGGTRHVCVPWILSQLSG